MVVYLNILLLSTISFVSLGMENFLEYGTGIYCIQNTITGNKYIGQSVNCTARFQKHKADLALNVHWATVMQEEYNEYGKKSFKAYTLLACLPKHLNYLEAYFINLYKPTYNETEFQANVRHKRHAKLLAKKVDQLDLKTGEVIKTWESAKVASEALNVSAESIGQVCRGKRIRFLLLVIGGNLMDTEN